eukprot:Ihof_evm8s40 gene=Ihof_evmTU8s40
MLALPIHRSILGPMCTLATTSDKIDAEIDDKIENVNTLQNKIPDVNVLESTNHNITQTPKKNLFAIVHIGGSQHKVGFNDILITHKLMVNLGVEIQFNKILMAGSPNFTIIGLPLLDIKSVIVKGRVVEHTETKPLIIYKKKRRKGYQRWRENTYPITAIRITSIDTVTSLNAANTPSLRGSLFGDAVCPMKCCQPRNLYHSLATTLRDPIYGLIGQDGAREEILSKFYFHIKTPTSPLVLFLIGSTGVGKTHTMRIIERAIYRKCKPGLLWFSGQDYIPEGEHTFIARFLSKIDTIVQDVGEDEMITVFFDEFNQLRNYPGTIDYMKSLMHSIFDGQISMRDGKRINVQSWVFVFATDFNAFTQEAPLYNNFVTKWIHLGTEHCKTSPDIPECSQTNYNKDRMDMVQKLHSAHSKYYGDFQFGYKVPYSHIIPYKPFESIPVITFMRALSEQTNQNTFNGLLYLQSGFLETVQHRLVPSAYVERACDSITETCDAMPLVVANRGAWGLKKAWDDVNDIILHIVGQSVVDEYSTNYGIFKYESSQFLAWFENNQTEICVCK